MTWLVIGGRGLLGTDLTATLRERGVAYDAPTHAELDLLDATALAAVVPGHDVVVNCAAWTDVDGAETAEDEATAVNGTGVALLAQACAEAGARLVHVSTDYVFSGDASTAYDEDAALAPLSAYGRSKAVGEDAVRAASPRHLVVRTAWLYGAHGNCFPRTIARVLQQRGSCAVVTDQVGQPTWTVDVADLVVRLVEADVPGGNYHATSQGRTSWWGFARAVAETAGLDPAVVGEATTADFPRPAPRPAWSVLGHERFARVGVEPIGSWEQRWALAGAQVLQG